jgi:hypothetical protein
MKIVAIEHIDVVDKHTWFSRRTLKHRLQFSDIGVCPRLTEHFLNSSIIRNGAGSFLCAINQLTRGLFCRG